MVGMLYVLLFSSIAVDATLSDGRQLSGELVRIGEGKVQVSEGGKQLEFGFSDVEKLSVPGAKSSSSGRTVVRLVDGSELRASSLVASKGQATMESPTGATATLCPIKAFHSIRWFASDEELNEQWKEILQNVGSEDFLVIKKKGNLDYIAGLIVGITAENIAFEYSGNMLDVPIGRVAGVVFGKKPESLPSTKLTLTTSSESVWQLRSARSSGTSVELTSVAGATQTLPLSEVRLIEFVRAGVTYATDLEPLQADYRPFLGSATVQESLRLLGLPQQDISFGGEPLSVKDKNGKPRTFKRGIAMQSRSELTYRLAGKYQRFQATVGLDPKAPAQADLNLRLFADGKEVLSRSITISDATFDIDVPIAQANRVRILVDYGKNLDIGDRLHLGDARFVK